MRKLVFFFALITAIVPVQKNHAQVGFITTKAGIGSPGYGGDGIPATAAAMGKAMGVFADGAGNVYFPDPDYGKIRKVDASGIVATFAGGGSSTADGIPATSAKIGFYSNGEIVEDAAGNILFVDDHRIRKVNTITGIISTIAGGIAAGYSGDGGPATAAELNSPVGLCFDASGSLYIGDEDNYRIRKIDTAGIISTIAGTGASGFSGDGGPATGAELAAPDGLFIDTAGNLYFADRLNHRIRKINSAGIITTIAGNGTSGFIGDGGAATAASFYEPSHVCMDKHSNLYIADFRNSRIRRIDTAGIISTYAGGGSSTANGVPATSASLTETWGLSIDAYDNIYIPLKGRFKICKVVDTGTPTWYNDSLRIRTTKLCNGPEILAFTNSYSKGMYVKTDFGDGNTTSSSLLKNGIAGGYTMISHSYIATGTYPITHVLYGGFTPIDTISYSYNYTFCRTLPVKIFAESDSNCVLDSGETKMYLPSLTQVDSNGVRIGIITATAGFNYNAYAPHGTVYSFKLLFNSGSSKLTCPATGILTDTVLSTVATYPDKFFWLNSHTGSSSLDIGINTVVPVTGVNDQWGHIYISNKYGCDSGATVTMNFSPKWNFETRSASPPVAKVAGNSAAWNLDPIRATDGKPTRIYFVLRAPITGPLKIGDTIISSFIVRPSISDSNLTDNTEIRLDTVRAGCDPNAIYVSPNGCVPNGISNLKYTITFENTGNDTAHNIYVLDTLSDKLDPQSIRIVMASANMNFGILKDGPYTIAKFDFPNIKLLDSSHHGLCDGTVIYTIDMQKGLTNDTRIYNRAGIYFDVNEVVLTNTSENIIGCPPLAIVMPVEKASVSIFPNPTTDELTITTEKQYSSFTITNSIGQVMMEQPINGTQTKVSVKTLSAGLYYISLRGSDGVTVQKFVKL